MTNKRVDSMSSKLFIVIVFFNFLIVNSAYQGTIFYINNKHILMTYLQLICLSQIASLFTKIYTGKMS